MREALSEGRLSAERFTAWESLRREAAAAALRGDEHLRRSHERRVGRIVKEYKRIHGDEQR